MFKLIITIVLLFSFGSGGNANPRIFVIRHALVLLEKPGWVSSESAAQYKTAYNNAPIAILSPYDVLQMIEGYESTDSIFSSPQSRALRTAELLFGSNAVIIADSTLMELDYEVVQIPFLHLPVNTWLLISRISWMMGVHRGGLPARKERVKDLYLLSDEVIRYAQSNSVAVIVAHGLVNREFIKILKSRGWTYCQQGRGGFGNLSVNCLEYSN